ESSTKDSVRNMRVRINDCDDCAIGRRVLALERKASFLASAPEDKLACASTNRINRNQRLTLRPQIFIERLHDQKLTPFQRIILHRRNNCPDYARQLHKSL